MGLTNIFVCGNQLKLGLPIMAKRTKIIQELQCNESRFPPEFLLQEFSNCTHKSDMFLIGSVLYFMIFNHLPFNCWSKNYIIDDSFEQCINNDFDDTKLFIEKSCLAKSVKQLLIDLLEVDIEKRISFDSLISQPMMLNNLATNTCQFNSLNGKSKEIESKGNDKANSLVISTNTLLFKNMKIRR